GREGVGGGENSAGVETVGGREGGDSVLAEMKPPREDDDEPVQSDTWIARVLHAPAAFIRASYKRLHKIDNLKPDSPLYWQTRDVLDRLETSNSHPSNIIDVGYMSSDPPS